jgi:hypothetical protein
MAIAYLRRYEAEDGELPRVCMRCGAPAQFTVSKRFSWHPPWVIALVLIGLLPYAIVAIILTKRMRVQAPLCDRHRGHWLRRSVFSWGGLLLLIALGIGAIILLAAADQRPRPRAGAAAPELGGLACGGVVVLGVIWAVGLAIAQLTAIRPTEITDRDISLAGVSGTFMDALDEDREARAGEDDDEEYEDEEEDYRPRRARRRPQPRAEDDERVYDPDRRRPRQPPDDEYE